MTNPPPIIEWGRYRTFSLFLLAVSCMRIGLLYAPIPAESVPSALRFITAFLPIWFLGCVWLALAVVALVAVWWRWLHDWVFVFASLYTLYWALSYAWALVDNIPPRPPAEVANAVILYLLLATFLGFIGLMTRTGYRRRRQRTVVEGTQTSE